MIQIHDREFIKNNGHHCTGSDAHFAILLPIILSVGIIIGGCQTVFADSNDREYQELTELENAVQSGVYTKEIKPESYLPNNQFIAKVVNLFPVIESINPNQADILRLNLANYIGNKKGSLKDKLDISPIKVKYTHNNYSAKSYLIYDPAFDQIILESNAQQIRPIASISKLVTAMVALDSFPKNQQFIMSGNAKTVGSSSGVPVGKMFSLPDALVYLLTRSANDVANQVMATHDNLKTGGSFVKKMNDKVVTIGLLDTSFQDPSGLSAGNKSTAHDLAKLLDYMTQEYPELLSLSRQSVLKRKNQIFVSSNPLRFNSNWLGGKNGYISASGRTLASILKTGAQEVIIITLGSDYYDEGRDTISLLNLVR